MPNSQEKINVLLKKAEDGIRKVFESEKYQAYLTAMSKFHQYSFRNILLIQQQKADATLVAGYAAWQKKFNRQVLRGEKGIQIIGYSSRKLKKQVELKDDNGDIIYSYQPDGTRKPATKTEEYIVPSYIPVYVYDISQTDGKPLPTLVNELTGEVTDYNKLMQAIISTSSFPISFEQIKGEAKGYCDPISRKIAIKSGMSEVQTIKTAIHEITHADLHAPEQNLALAARTDRRTREIEAESTAFVVCSHYNIDTSDYSFGYLAGWSSDKELSELKGSLEIIQKQANDLISRIDGNLMLLKEKELSVDQSCIEEKKAEELRSYTEMLDTVRFDGDIDLDREKTREQLGFKDNIPAKTPKIFNDVLKHAKEKAYQYNQSIKEHPEPLQEREVT